MIEFLRSLHFKTYFALFLVASLSVIGSSPPHLLAGESINVTVMTGDLSCSSIAVLPGRTGYQS